LSSSFGSVCVGDIESIETAMFYRQLKTRECPFFLVHDFSPKMIYHQMYNNINTKRHTVCSTRGHPGFICGVRVSQLLTSSNVCTIVCTVVKCSPHPHPHWPLSVFFVLRLLTTTLLFPNNANHWFYTDISVIHMFSANYLLPHINRHMQYHRISHI